MWMQLIITASDKLYELCNRLVGHYWLLDNLIALPLYNYVVKAAIVGGCFLAAWHMRESEAAVVRTRRILLVTLMASMVVVVANQVISKHVFLPRPFIQSQKAFHLEGDQLVESRRLPYRVPLDHEDQLQYHRMQNGELLQNDLTSFPSDHAAFYVTIAVGILLASRGVGWLAVAWTFIVTLGSRVVTGQHSPLDIVVGAGLGFVILVGFQLVFERWLRPVIDPVVRWTIRHQTFATVVIFIALFEATNTMQDLKALIETGAAIARYLRPGA